MVSSDEFYVMVAVAFLTIIFIYISFCFLFAESFLIQTFRGELLSDSEGRNDPRSLRGIEEALEFVLKSRKNRNLSPQLVITPEVNRVARVSRRLGGPGIILMSRGLIDWVSDEELVFILTSATSLLTRSGVVTRSALATSWLHLNPLYQTPRTPFQALFSWGLMPLGRYLSRKYASLDVLTHGASPELKIFP